MVLPYAGFTLSVPETVMGLTFLAAGGCMPEAISSCLAIRKGKYDLYKYNCWCLFRS